MTTKKTRKKPQEKIKLPRLTRDFLINKFDISDPTYSKISRAQARTIAEKMMQYAQTNIKAIEKAGLYSPAYEVYKRSGGKLSLTKSMSRASAIMELARLQQFLQSETATAKGIRTVNRRQDERIFGTNPNTGRPRRTMTLEQRKAFWNAYNEFRNGSAYAQFRNMNSNVVQQALYAIGLDRRKFTADDFNRLADILPDMQRQYENTGSVDLASLKKARKYNWEDSANVLTGRRTQRKK